MKLGAMGLGIGGRRMASQPSETPQSFLAGTTGFALDPSLVSTLWLENTRVTQASAANDTIGAMDLRFGTLSTSYVNGGASQRPPWDGVGGLVYDGTTTRLLAYNGSYTGTASMSGCSITVRCRPATKASRRMLISFSTGAVSSVRLSLSVEANGAVAAEVRRLDADTPTTITSTAGDVADDEACTLQVTVDFQTTGEVRILKNGVQIATGTVSGTPALSENTSSGRARIGSNLSSTPGSLFNGSIGRYVFDRTPATPAKLAGARAWVEETAI